MLTLRLQTIADCAARASFLGFVCAGAFVSSKFVLAIAMLCGTAYLLFDVIDSGGRVGAVLLTFMFGVFVSYPLVLLNNGFSSGFMHGGLVLGSSGVALYFARTRRTRLLVCTLLVLIGYYLITVTAMGEARDAAFLGSQNRVSTLFLALGVLLFAVRQSQSDAVVAGLIVVVCVLAGGSAGILGGVMLFTLVAVRLTMQPGPHAIVVRVSLLAVAAGLVMAVWFLLSEEALMKLAIDRIVGGDVRYQIIRAYASNNLRGLNLLAGTKLIYSFEVIDDGALMTLGNLHNSYLSAHSKTGIFSVLVLGSIVFRALVLLRSAPYVAGLLLVILARAFSDTVFILDGTYNFALIYFLLPLELVVPGGGADSAALRGKVGADVETS